MNELAINHPAIGNNKLSLKLSSFLGSPQLYFNGIKVEKEKKAYSITQLLGKPFEILIKQKIYDAIPKIIINGEPFEIAEPLKWYEYVWMGLPILLVLQGGAIGALLGIFAVKINSTIFRSERSSIAKYLITLVINIAITSFYLIIALLLNSAVNTIK